MKHSGFTLVEILIFMLIVLVLVTMMLASTGSLHKARGTNLKSTATHIASCEVERLRSLAYTSLPADGTAAIGAPCDADLTKLPACSSPPCATRTLANYAPPDPDIKEVTINVNWVESGVAENIKIVTLISKYGP